MTMAKNKHHDGSGPTQRQLRVGELIRRTLSDVLMRGDIHDPDLTAMSITVGEVRTSPARPRPQDRHGLRHAFGRRGAGEPD
jgi:ribosome-binding factor A